MRIYPVIHYLDRETAFSEVQAARACGADGVFLISHHGADQELLEVAGDVKRAYPDFRIGANLLTWRPDRAVFLAHASGLDMVWADNMGVSSWGLTQVGSTLSKFGRKHPEIQLFASVAFKYQAPEPSPAQAALYAIGAGFIPTTSGAATGSAPEVAKVARMSAAAGGTLAVASGMTPDNVAEYAPYLSHILVATGVALDEHRIDPAKLGRLIAVTKEGTR